MAPPPTVSIINWGMELKINWGMLNGSGEALLECVGVPSGLLHGVAVGEKLLRPDGVLNAEGVAALIPVKKILD